MPSFEDISQDAAEYMQSGPEGVDRNVVQDHYLCGDFLCCFTQMDRTGKR